MSKKYIEVDALIERVKRYCKQWSDITGDYKYGVVDAFDIFNSAVFAEPAADVVEVVRCGQCKFFQSSGCFIGVQGAQVSSDNYCAWGQRKDG